MEALPWPDQTFDVVAAFNAFQYAPDPANALREAARLLVPDGLLAVCRWGPPATNDLFRLLGSLANRSIATASDLGAEGLVATLCDAGLPVFTSGSVATEMRYPNLAALTAGLKASGAFATGLAQPDVAAHAQDYMLPDGSYVLRNRLMFAIGCREPAAAGGAG